MFLAHLGLVWRGRWAGDEYILLGQFRDFGLPVLWNLVGWVPRPVTDPLFYGYTLLVRAAGAPLTGPFLLALWAVLALACVGPALRRQPRPTRALAGLALLGLFLVGHDVTEMFFWPAAALAYLPELAAATWLFWCLADGEPGRAGGVALVLVAGCHEVGAFLAVAFAPLALAWAVARRERGPRWAWPGFAVGLAVMLQLVLGHRVGVVEWVASGPTFHQPGASLVAAVPRLLLELVSGGGAHTGAPAILAAVATRLALFAGVRWSWPAERRAALLPPFALALLAAGYGAIATGLFQFGQLCCERQDTLRQCFATLAIAAVAVASRPQGLARGPVAASAALLLAVAIPFAGRVPDLVAEYRLYPASLRAVQLTWASGLAPGTDAMTLALPPDGPVVAHGAFQAGHYEAGPPTRWDYDAVLGMFHKRRLTVTEPGETAPAP